MLADQVQVFEQEANGEWVVKVITKVRKTIEVATPAAAEIVQFTTVEHLAYDELPPPVRANWLRTGKSRYEFNLTEQRDSELRLGFSVPPPGRQDMVMMTVGSGIQAVAKHGSGTATVTWIIVGVVAAVVVVVVVGCLAWWARHRHRDDGLSLLVADALGGEWAARLGADAESVRQAVLRGKPAGLRDRLAALVSDVEVTFEFAQAGGRGTAVVRCQYARDSAVTAVTLAVPWYQVPQPVRADYLRSGRRHASQHWSVLQTA